MTERLTFDAGAVLRAVAALAEHAVAGTLTADIKAAWAREHAQLFGFPPRFPPAPAVADHIERVAAYSKTVEKTVLNVLGAARVKGGLAAVQKDETVT